MDNLLREIRDLLHTIQSSRKGSNGSPDSVYLPQLPVDRVDKLEKRVSVHLSPLSRLKADWASKLQEVLQRRSDPTAGR